MKLPKLQVLFQILFYVYKSRKLQVIVREFALIIQVFLEIWSIYILGKFLDTTSEYILNLSAFDLSNFLASDSFYFLALSTGVALIILSLDRLRQALSANIYHHILFNFQTDFFNKIADSNLQEVESKEFRNLLTLTDKYAFSNIWEIYKTFTDFVKFLVTGISALALLVGYVNWMAVLIILIALPEPIAGYYNRNKRHKYEEKEVEKSKWISYVENLMTRIQYFMEMKVDNTFKSIKKEYSEKCEVLRDKRVELLSHLYIDITLFAVLGRIFVVIFVIYSVSISIVKKLTIGNIKVIYDYSYKVYESFYNIFETLFQISNGIAYAESFFKFLSFQGFGDLATGDVILNTKTPKLQFRNLDFKYPSEQTNTLENLDITVNPGENVMIIGDDGSGKSTLIKLLCGLYKIEAGDYEIDGISIRLLKRGELKRRISAIFQDYVNYNMSLKKNITLSSDISSINRAHLDRALKISGVDKLMKKYKIDENQMLGKYISGGKDISPGFWQRIAIARTIYRDKGIFLLDEPFTYIDNIEEHRILKEFLEFAGSKRTVIYITRDERHTELFDKIYRLSKGKLIRE
jgi:ABC-type multidrug transport system fused ATPase/permease subunit